MKTVLVTGCSRPSGFGQRIAKKLAAEGFEVYASLRNVGRAAGLTEWAKEHQAALHTLEHDVTSPTQNRSVVEEILERSGSLFGLVNNVGMSSFGALETLHEEHIRQVMETNFFSAVDLTRVALQPMRERGGGRILFVSSMAGVTGIPGESIYCASKFALEGLAESLALETAKFGIGVSTIRPGFFNTGMSQDNTDSTTFFREGTPYDEFNKRVIKSTSEGEVNGEDPELVASMVLESLQTSTAKLHWHPGESAPAILKARSMMDDSEWQTYVMDVLGMTDWLQSEQTREAI